MTLLLSASSILIASAFMEIATAVGVFVVTIVVLVALILAAKQFLIPAGDVNHD